MILPGEPGSTVAKLRNCVCQTARFSALLIFPARSAWPGSPTAAKDKGRDRRPLCDRLYDLSGRRQRRELLVTERPVVCGT